MLRNADGGGGCLIFWKKCYEGVMFTVISVTRGWVGVQLPPFKCYVTQMGVGGGCLIFWKKRYEGVMFTVISVTRGGWGSNFQKHSVT